MHFDFTMLNIGSERQLFLDDLLIESVENVCRTWHRPLKEPTGPLIVRDQPWEHVSYFSCNTYHVLHDPQDGLFKCWYTDWYKPESKPDDIAIGASVKKILYAESEDGLRWRKPRFMLYPHAGEPTNVVIPDAFNIAVLIDPHETDGNKRYKALHTRFVTGDRDTSAVVAATSPDGIHWTQTRQRPVIGRSGARTEDVLVLHYDEFSRMFVLNTRHYDMQNVARNLANPVVGHFTPPYYPLDWSRMAKRRVFQAESADLLHWTIPYPILTPEDGQDDLDETFYGMCQSTVGGLKIGFLNTFHYVANTMCVQLVYSRDGKRWVHLNKRRPLLKPGGEGAWDAYMVTLPCPPIEVGDELFFFHGGSSNHHDWWMTGAREGIPTAEATDPATVFYALGLARLRRDGYASLDAGSIRPGILITRPFISGGTRLVVNARCKPGGSIAAEIADVYDQVLPGFSRAECDPFRGDAVSHAFTWQGRAAIPAGPLEHAEYPKPEIERFRKIRFYMENTELYTFMLAD
jgi:hypothetical protein